MMRGVRLAGVFPNGGIIKFSLTGFIFHATLQRLTFLDQGDFPVKPEYFAYNPHTQIVYYHFIGSD
jgi:hypothetical protein